MFIYPASRVARRSFGSFVATRLVLPRIGTDRSDPCLSRSRRCSAKHKLANSFVPPAFAAQLSPFEGQEVTALQPWGGELGQPVRSSAPPQPGLWGGGGLAPSPVVTGFAYDANGRLAAAAAGSVAHATASERANPRALSERTARVTPANTTALWSVWPPLPGLGLA